MRQQWVAGELAAMRTPDIRFVNQSEALLSDVAEAWRASRVDVEDGTAATHRVNRGRIVRVLGSRRIDSIKASDVASFVLKLAEEGLARESIRKTLATLAMVFDFHGVSAESGSRSAYRPSPAR
jgi:hypothetical protein